MRSYLERLEYRVRYYRFFFLAPLYLALAVFLVAMREFRFAWVAVTLAAVQPGRQFLPGIPTALHRRGDVPVRAGERDGLLGADCAGRSGAADRLPVRRALPVLVRHSRIRRFRGFAGDAAIRDLGRHQPRESGAADLRQPAACQMPGKLLVFVRY